ncbi:MAG TPA: protein-L-isoaspartate(D-aspartate) O-methyltransferase [Rhizomicrobium sp.]|nr:protein-L-isoaspartate(D-aspartate) O-methyltransferase [Rhizomicrobium sp.]
MTQERAGPLIQTLREQGISDARVLAAIEKIPRDLFVEDLFERSAYENTALPIPCGQTISQPYVVAYMTAALELDEKMRVLEIGTGSGYQSAVLSGLCRRVYTIERHRPLLAKAQERFNLLKLDNITTRFGDGYKGWEAQAPFDRIIVTAAVAKVPDLLVGQLKIGGKMVIPVGEQGGTESISQLLTKIIKTETGVIREQMIPVMFVPMLPGLPQEPQNAGGSQRKA